MSFVSFFVSFVLFSCLNCLNYDLFPYFPRFFFLFSVSPSAMCSFIYLIPLLLIGLWFGGIVNINDIFH